MQLRLQECACACVLLWCSKQMQCSMLRMGGRLKRTVVLPLLLLQLWGKVLPLGLIFFVASFNLTILQVSSRDLRSESCADSHWRMPSPWGRCKAVRVPLTAARAWTASDPTCPPSAFFHKPQRPTTTFQQNLKDAIMVTTAAQLLFHPSLRKSQQQSPLHFFRTSKMPSW